jgi:hypothetical protein
MFWVTMPALRNHGNLETARETGFSETENGPKPPSMNRCQFNRSMQHHLV